MHTNYCTFFMCLACAYIGNQAKHSRIKIMWIYFNVECATNQIEGHFDL